MDSKDKKEGVTPPSENKDNKNKGKKEVKKEELSEEDQRKKEELELLVTRAQDESPELQATAIQHLSREIQTSTSSMTSVPKPLKFLRPHFGALKTYFSTLPDSNPNKQSLGDVLSVLAMTMGAEGERESLSFKLKGHTTDLATWGHEYVRNLSGEIGQEYQLRAETSSPADDLLQLVDQIIPFNMKHNAEPDACDLLMEVEKLPNLLEHVDEANFERVCLYLIACSHYVPEPEDTQALKVALEIYKKMKRYPESLDMAIRLNDMPTVHQIYSSCEDRVVKSQLAFLLARQNLFIDEEDESLENIINNTNMADHFLALARDLDVVEPKTPEDIYKDSAEPRTSANTSGNPTVDSARQNLANTFVNAFVNAAFGKDKLITEEETKWIYKNKDHGMMSAAASLGMVLLWDVDGGLTQIDKYLYSKEDYIKAGALLAIGVVHSGVRNNCDPALALLGEHVGAASGTSEASSMIRVGAILGLGIAYAGSAREDLLEVLSPVLEDSSAGLEIIGVTALAIGLIFVGSSHGAATESLVLTLMTKAETEPDAANLKNPYARFLALGLGLVYLAKQDDVEVVLESLKVVSGEIGKVAGLTVETCAYAGTGNVLKIQNLLQVCGEHLEKDNLHQGAATIGIALIAMGEELGREMCVRTFGNLLQYAEPVVKRAVPLALGLLYVGDPEVGVMDTLSKLTHDADAEVAQGAIFALGLIGSGTNNARISNLLKNLAGYYAREPNHLLFVRLAQGLLHMGKGTLSLGTYHSQGIMHRVAVGGLLTVLHAMLDSKGTILGKAHYLLYTLVCGIYPRMLMTFDEDLKSLPVPVRVGHAVDVVGQAGRPKTITGSQTHTTPVLIGYGERAELATDEYIPVSSTLEGFVILKPNPNASKKFNLK